jgi:hypothetical protein
MAEPGVLEFAFNDQPIRFPVGEVETKPSPFTGHQLRTLSTQVTISPLDADLVKTFLATAPVTAGDGSVWTGNIDMESYTNDGPHSLTITWKESEQLMAETVEFEGLALSPTCYEERENEDGTICVAFQAKLTSNETETLRSLTSPSTTDRRYFPVVRRGVSDDPRSMRLGRVLWQQFDDGTIGNDITLVDEAFDASGDNNTVFVFGGEPQVGNLVRQVSSLLVQFETLIAELESAGAIAPEAVERIRASAETLAPDRRHIFFEVADLSKW